MVLSSQAGKPERRASREFGTAAGYALHVLKRLPGEGDHFSDQGWRFEVVDMDGRRIDKLLVSAEKSLPDPEG